MEVLAVLASEVTPNRSNRVCLRAGMEVEEWFFLYRVNPPRNYLTVDQAVEDTTPVFSNPAYLPSSIRLFYNDEGIGDI